MALILSAIAMLPQLVRGDLPPLFPGDPTGKFLPPALPKMVDSRSNVVWIDQTFTTQQYSDYAAGLVLNEANKVARDLNLSDDFPITKSNAVRIVITPFGYNILNGRVGSVETRHYCYYVSVGNKLSYIENTHQVEECRAFQNAYTLDAKLINTNAAYQCATQMLAAAHMDVDALNRDGNANVFVDNVYTHSPEGKFVPIYEVGWMRKTPNPGLHHKKNILASVRVFTPTRYLLQLRVEDSQYILRKPIEITNPSKLIFGPEKVYIMPPAIHGGNPAVD